MRKVIIPKKRPKPKAKNTISGVTSGIMETEKIERTAITKGKPAKNKLTTLQPTDLI